MKLSFNECKEILDTLPIGYYCGRKIEVALDKEEETSYYVPQTDNIVISLPIIQQGLEKITDEAWRETAVRSMLYHELSHAILTPDDLYQYWPNSKDILNIFEVERIETLLNDYYMNVNFKQNIMNICGTTPKIDMNNPMSLFFAAVRYRYGKKEWTDEVERIIEAYKDINCNTEDSFYYSQAIIRLWEKINRNKPTSTDELQSAEQTLKDLCGNVEKGEKRHSTSEQENTTGNESTDGQTSSNKEEEEGTKEITAVENAHGKGKKLTAEDVKTILNPLGKLLPSERQKVEEMAKYLEMLICNFHKKNGGGNGYNAYSGVFNPRALVREDYKYFDRKAQINGNNKYGTCHLNLVIDASGSFYHNETLVNGILNKLSEIEKRYPDFSLDISFINEDFKTCQSVKERKLNCGGGNTIPNDFIKIMSKLQKPNSCNYNIVLFDGDALSGYMGKASTYDKQFRQIDQPQTCLITDDANEIYMRGKHKFQKAKVIITNRYTQELIENIKKAFSIMFA